jgi:hypothetical protein
VAIKVGVAGAVEMGTATGVPFIFAASFSNQTGLEGFAGSRIKK